MVGTILAACSQGAFNASIFVVLGFYGFKFIELAKNISAFLQQVGALDRVIFLWDFPELVIIFKFL